MPSNEKNQGMSLRGVVEVKMLNDTLNNPKHFF